jgi:hypothetical protein
MSTLDEITKEKQRVSEALARVDAQREKLTGQLGELEATERVLARYSTGTRATKTALAKTPTTATKAALQCDRGRHYDRKTSRQAPVTAAIRSPPATGKTQRRSPAVRGARPNHVGVVIARHKRAGRIELRGGKLYATQSDPGSSG